MSSTNSQLVRGFYDSLFSGQFDAAKAMLDPGLRIVEAEGLPYGGVYEGIDGLMALFAKVGQTWNNLNVDVHEIVGDGEWIVALSEMQGTSSVTGKSFRQRLAEVFRVRNGKILEITPFYFDTKALNDLHRAG